MNTRDQTVPNFGLTAAHSLLASLVSSTKDPQVEWSKRHLSGRQPWEKWSPLMSADIKVTKTFGLPYKPLPPLLVYVRHVWTVPLNINILERPCLPVVSSDKASDL